MEANGKSQSQRKNRRGKKRTIRGKHERCGVSGREEKKKKENKVKRIIRKKMRQAGRER